MYNKTADISKRKISVVGSGYIWDGVIDHFKGIAENLSHEAVNYSQ
jgi:hypothetical protein